MEVLFVFLGATGLAFALIWIRRRRVYRSWPSALRVGLSAMFFMTGITHFVLLREDLVAMVPPFLPAPELLVTLTGVLELAGAVGLLLKRSEERRVGKECRSRWAREPGEKERRRDRGHMS